MALPSSAPRQPNVSSRHRETPRPVGNTGTSHLSPLSKGRDFNPGAEGNARRVPAEFSPAVSGVM